MAATCGDGAQRRERGERLSNLDRIHIRQDLPHTGFSLFEAPSHARCAGP